MKKTVVFFLMLVSICTFAQSGKLYPKNGDILTGGFNTYVYEPPAGIVVPENAFINLYFLPFRSRTIQLVKKEKNYEFTVTVPDSIPFMEMTVTDRKKKTIDDNSGKGYVVYLKNRTKEELEKAELSKLAYFGLSNYLLKLTISPEETISRFDELYASNPELKKEDSYLNYLYFKFQKDNDRFRQAIIECADQFIKRGDEKSLYKASDAYSWLKMNDKCIEIQGIALAKYPKGQFAKNKFFKDFYSHQDRNEKFILEEMNKFVAEFNDTSALSKNQFLYGLLSEYISKADTLNIKKYSLMMHEDILVASMYNNAAWQLSGQDLTTPGKDLSFAEKLSKQSIELIKKAMNGPGEKADIIQLMDSYIGYTDTYALILYKQQKYDKAFELQDEISRLNDIDTGGKERYAGYAEKAKGLEFAKAYIEKQLKAGVESMILINQLQEIYKKLNLPMADVDTFRGNFRKSMVQKTKDHIIQKYGSFDAIDFTLTNMKGEQVKLSDYRGKVVVLDFWATWCGPCRASFPKMQELVTKYKNSPVEFFFIDVWERMKPADMKANVAKFITENKYSFHVLYDFKDEVVAKYKIEGIPTKILIDKNGKIFSVVGSIDDLSEMIDQNI